MSFATFCGLSVRFYFLSSMPEMELSKLLPQEVRVGNLTIGIRHPVRIMGVINLSPESFYSESVVDSEEKLVQTISQMKRNGVDLIDIGGVSTAPAEIYGTSKISPEKELERVVWAMKILRSKTKIPISIDTTSSVVAEAALDLGASIVNDISGLQDDSKMVEVAAERDSALVLMARCKDGCKSVKQSLEAIRESFKRAQDGGLGLGKIILDPGIGFGKPVNVDFDLLRGLHRFMLFGQPLLVGVSRKAFIGSLLDQPSPEDRLIGTIAATSLAVANGANIIRAHDVREAKMASAIGEALRSTSQYSDENAVLLDIHDEKDAEFVIERVGTGPSIRRALSRKAVMVNLLLMRVKTPGALIIKQEMLALGGDAAYHYDTIDFGTDETNILVMGTPLQVDLLAKKIGKMKSFGLQSISNTIVKLMNEREQKLG